MPILQQVARRTAEMIGRESAVIRNMRPLHESLHKGMPWPINAVTYRVDPHHRDRFAHEYDPAVAALLKASIRPGAVCFDVGANVASTCCNWRTGRVQQFGWSPSSRTRKPGGSFGNTSK